MTALPDTIPDASNWKALVERDAKPCTALHGGPACCLYADTTLSDAPHQPVQEITENNHNGGNS